MSIGAGASANRGLTVLRGLRTERRDEIMVLAA